MEFLNLPSFMRNSEFAGKPSDSSFKAKRSKVNKKFIGLQAKRQGETFEEYFKLVINQVQSMTESPIVCFRKHSNEIVKTLANNNRFDLIKRLGYLKGDLDYSITLKCGYTVFVECKSGSSPLSKEQKELISKYKEHGISYFLFTEKDKRNEPYIKATYNFQKDAELMFNMLSNIEVYTTKEYPF